MKKQPKPITILMAEDDPDDRQMTKEAFEESHLANELRFVENGVELMDYLHRRNQYCDPATSPRPGIILLDLNMPKKDGREALKEIKADPNLRNIRVIVLTTSDAEDDIARIYNLSAASYITKPVTFAALADVIKTLGKYWLEIVELPRDEQGGWHGSTANLHPSG
jgi:two-component system response regulator